jgi:hypothetical protein
MVVPFLLMYMFEIKENAVLKFWLTHICHKMRNDSRVLYFGKVKVSN